MSSDICRSVIQSYPRCSDKKIMWNPYKVKMGEAPNAKLAKLT